MERPILVKFETYDIFIKKKVREFVGIDNVWMGEHEL